MLVNITTLASLLLTALAVGGSAQSNMTLGSSPPTARTLNGTYAGRYLPKYDQDVFLGVPYAQPPLGDLRFANPRSLNTSFPGARNATEYAPECVGYGVSSIYIR